MGQRLRTYVVVAVLDQKGYSFSCNVAIALAKLLQQLGFAQSYVW